MGQHIRLKLTPQDRHTLEQRVKKGEDKARTQTRARVLLLLDRAHPPARTHQEVADILGITRNPVSQIARRYLQEGLDAALLERPRPGAAPKITAVVETQLITLCCSDPPSGRVRWTLRLLAQKMVELGHIESISNVAIYHALKKMNSNRGRKSAGASRKRVQST